MMTQPLLPGHLVNHVLEDNFGEIDADVDAASVFLIDEYAGMGKDEIREMIYDVQEVIPEEIISRFDSIIHIEEMLQWEKGDLTNVIWKHVQTASLKRLNGRPYTFQDVCYFVSARFLRWSRSYNTVKAWALVARRFPPETREKYNYQDLPFSHFAYAAKRRFDVVCPDGQRQWEKVLDYSKDGAGKQGYDVSVSQLEEAFEGKTRDGQFLTGLFGKEEYAPPKIEDEFTQALQALIALADKLDGNKEALTLIRQGLELLRLAADRLFLEDE